MFVCCECCVLSGRGLCDGPITRPEESYRLRCVVVCDLETWWMRTPWPTGVLLRQKQTSKLRIGRPALGHVLYSVVFSFGDKMLRPKAGMASPFFDVSRWQTTTHHSRWDSSWRVISLSQRPLSDHRLLLRQCFRWDSNSQSQKASYRRPTRYVQLHL